MPGRRILSYWIAAAALVVGMSACTSEVSLGSEGTLRDDPFRERGERCGAVLCEAGEVCCNESCGICTEPDEACTLQLCDMCQPMEARGEGECLIFFGYSWNGSACEGLGGCECVGEHCDHLFETRAECEETFASCREGDPTDPEGEPCGPTTCEEGQVCCNESCGTCTEPGESCLTLRCGDDDGTEPPPEGEACGPVVCNEGQVCCNESCGICTEPGGGCIDLQCEPCQAMDAEGEGHCRISFGYAWDGRQCAHLGGCSCQGDHCDHLFSSQEECERAYADCIRDEADRDPVDGETCARSHGDRCETDADCLVGGCGGELCYNPDQGIGATTCDCTAPDAACGCVDGTCAWWR